jgi:Tol biopolymer transport system component
VIARREGNRVRQQCRWELGYLCDQFTRWEAGSAHSPTNEVKPSWSHDGKWIYFSSSRTGAVEIWKIPAAGGEPIQVTRDGGYVAFESLDGKTL